MALDDLRMASRESPAVMATAASPAPALMDKRVPSSPKVAIIKTVRETMLMRASAKETRRRAERMGLPTFLAIRRWAKATENL